MRTYVPVLLGVAASACGGSDAGPTSPTTGALEIKTQTSGQAPSGSFRYRVDGEPAQEIGSNATISRPDLEPGSHVVQLTGLPDGCTVSSDNPQAISVEAGATTAVDFAVTCVPPVGTIQVETATSGPAPASYDLVVDADPLGAIGATETRALDSIASGVHSVGLSAVPANCQLAGDNPRSMTLQTGATATVGFAITCTAPPAEIGTLKVIIATTGVDPDGYRLVIDDGARQPIGVNGAVILANMAAGNHVVRLAGLATGCTPAEANPRQVSVTSGGTATVGFTITCAPPPTGSLRVTATTTGTNLDADGYTFSVDGGALQQIASNAAVVLDNLVAGSHTVALAGIAEGCVLDGGSSRAVSVSSGATADLLFTVRCAPGTSSQWTRMETGTTFSLYSVWGSSSSDVFTLGEPGGRFESGIFHYNGQAWSQQSTETGVTLYGIWGAAGNDVFAVGSSPLGARGFDGVLLHYDGSAWSTMPGPGVGTSDGSVEVSFFSAWGSSGTDVFAVGEASTSFNRALIAHYDGTGWSEMPLTARDDRVLKDVFGTSSQDVYAVGYFDASANLKRRLTWSGAARAARFLAEGVILHYDGSEWQEVQPVAANVAYSGVWASAPADVFVVGTTDDRGIILHFDGSSWSEMPSPPTGPLLDVWGTSASDVYAVGAGTLLHFDGGSWTESLAATQRLGGVWGSSPTEVFAAGSGGTVLRGTARLSATARR
jgi:hypothetical protein